MDPNLLFRIANLISDPLVVLSAEGIMQAANQPFATILGLPSHDLIGQSLTAFVETPEANFANTCDRAYAVRISRWALLTCNRFPVKRAAIGVRVVCFTPARKTLCRSSCCGCGRSNP
jgi:PAS domain-containing protein